MPIYSRRASLVLNRCLQQLSQQGSFVSHGLYIRSFVYENGISFFLLLDYVPHTWQILATGNLPQQLVSEGECTASSRGRANAPHGVSSEEVCATENEPIQMNRQRPLSAKRAMN